MSIQVTIDFSEQDLEFFRKAMLEAQAKTRGRDEKAILAGARQLARQTRSRSLPVFVSERLLSLDALTRMLEDEDWKLDGDSRKRVFQALAYFAEQTDLVPDDIPVLGLLDDAIMVELVARELHPELDAYTEFCRFRDEDAARQGIDPNERRRRLQAERRAMYTRMETRREERGRRGGSFSLFR